jgi:multisubunit Na+/H+ antiporter MnhE subunit
MGQSVQLGGQGGHGKLRLRTVFYALIPSAAMWMLLVGSPTKHEVLVGCFAVVLTALFLFDLQRNYPESVLLRWKDLLTVWRVLPAICRDTLSVIRVLLADFAGKPAPSLYRTVRWEHDGAEELRRGRGVLATAAMSASPNTIVLGIDQQTNLMIFHQVDRSPVDTMARELGAKP